MHPKKYLYLFIAFLLPGIIFVFLKYFGSNQFDVPIYYQDDTKDISAECDMEYIAPYSIPVQSLIELNDLTVIIFSTPTVETKLDFQLKRLVNEFKDDPVHVIKVDTIKSTDTGTVWQYVHMSSDDYVREQKCFYLMKKGFSIVLVDGSRKIRGYYEPMQKDIERLIVELKILLGA